MLLFYMKIVYLNGGNDSFEQLLSHFWVVFAFRLPSDGVIWETSIKSAIIA